MLFSKEITARDLDRLVGNPLSASHPYNPKRRRCNSRRAHPGVGQPRTSPPATPRPNAADGYKSDGDTLTGRLEYDSVVEFAPAKRRPCSWPSGAPRRP
jgi:hypothetical protein